MTKRIYGPVPSRRFGLSLGVDVVPFKVCTFDCIYCQLGATTQHTSQRIAFFSPQEVLKDIQEALDRGPKPDVITFAGSGEPTLYSELGTLVKGIRKLTDIPLLLITNGSLLFREDVAKDAACFDMVAPSLDAPDEETFLKINQPDPSLNFDQIVQGLVDFGGKFKGEVFLEVFLLAGINDSPEQIDAFARLVSRIQPHRVDVNTVARPVPGRSVSGVSPERLREVAGLLHESASSVEDYDYSKARAAAAPGQSILADVIIETIERRPCTLDDLGASLGAPRQEIIKALEMLRRDNRIVTMDRDSFVYYGTP